MYVPGNTIESDSLHQATISLKCNLKIIHSIISNNNNNNNDASNSISTDKNVLYCEQTHGSICCDIRQGK